MEIKREPQMKATYVIDIFLVSQKGKQKLGDIKFKNIFNWTQYG